MSIGALGTSSGQAQDYPTRPIQVIVPSLAAARATSSRILLMKCQTLGQNFVVDNRPGAGGNTGTAAAIGGGSRRLYLADEHIRSVGGQ
jgi:tripartite-type tricarboxylate transporter receptor subunit TctC